MSDLGERYTPRNYMYLVRKLFGGVITLDPASSYLADRFVKANQFYNQEDDGLAQDWYGKVYLCPPFIDPLKNVKKISPDWVNIALHQFNYGKHKIDSMVILINAKVGYRDFRNWVSHDDTTVILHKDRLAFISATNLIKYNKVIHKPSSSPQATIYLGPYKYKFLELFGPYGWELR